MDSANGTEKRPRICGEGAGLEIVGSCHLMSFPEQAVDKCGTDEPGDDAAAPRDPEWAV
jgi:hypothetical protein